MKFFTLFVPFALPFFVITTIDPQLLFANTDNGSLDPALIESDGETEGCLPERCRDTHCTGGRISDLQAATTNQDQLQIPDDSPPTGHTDSENSRSTED